MYFTVADFIWNVFSSGRVLSGFSSESLPNTNAMSSWDCYE